jgi:hypothetical protein
MEKTYKQKPISVKAMQWIGSNYSDMSKFLNLPCPSIDDIMKGVGLEIQTKRGLIKVRKSDYIVLNVDGQYYPYTPETFEELYEQE